MIRQTIVLSILAYGRLMITYFVCRSVRPMYFHMRALRRYYYPPPCDILRPTTSHHASIRLAFVHPAFFYFTYLYMRLFWCCTTSCMAIAMAGKTSAMLHMKGPGFRSAAFPVMLPCISVTSHVRIPRSALGSTVLLYLTALLSVTRPSVALILACDNLFMFCVRQSSLCVK